VKEISYGSKVIISSKNTSTLPVVVPRPVPVPVLPPVVNATTKPAIIPPVVIPIPTKPVIKVNETKEVVTIKQKEEIKAVNTEMVGKIGITGAGITLDTFGNPVGPQYDLVKDGALNTTVMIFDNHGGIGKLVASVGL
jgi:hypothetical protein